MKFLFISLIILLIGSVAYAQDPNNYLSKSWYGSNCWCYTRTQDGIWHYVDCEHPEKGWFEFTPPDKEVEELKIRVADLEKRLDKLEHIIPPSLYNPGISNLEFLPDRIPNNISLNNSY